MRYLVFLFVIFNLQAMELQEKLNAMVLKTYQDNVIAISRGFEDGIKFQDHIKMMNNNTFVARAICIKTMSKTSFWKVYRTTKGAVENQSQYTLISIPLSDIRPALLREIGSLNLDFLKEESQEALLKSN